MTKVCESEIAQFLRHLLAGISESYQFPGGLAPIAASGSVSCLLTGSGRCQLCLELPSHFQSSTSQFCSFGWLIIRQRETRAKISEQKNKKRQSSTVAIIQTARINRLGLTVLSPGFWFRESGRTELITHGTRARAVRPAYSPRGESSVQIFNQRLSSSKTIR